MKRIALLLLLSLPVVVAAEVVSRSNAKPSDPEFYIYKDAGARENHFIPSGWMGSYRSMKMSQNWTVNPHSGRTCVKITYQVNVDSETQWCGIYWQIPAMNWGNKKGGYDLSNYKKLTFWARGEAGDEDIEKFGVGGISGQTEDGDSGEASTDRIVLTKEWKQYTVDLNGVDLKHIIGGFLFSTSAEYNPKDIVFYLDDIKFSK